MSYVKRRIDITIALGQGDFGEGGYTVVKLTGLRASVQIHKGGAPTMDTAELRVFGMSQDIMNRVTAIGSPFYYSRKNVVSVLAGNEGSAMHLVFTGNIRQAWGNYMEAPDVFFSMVAMAGFVDKAKPVPPTGYNGGTDVAVAMKGFADTMKLGFVNDGVTGVLLHSPYWPGTAWEQAAKCAKAADINWYHDGQTLTIWPKDQARKGTIPEIGPDSGLIGYPAFTDSGTAFRTLYNPTLRLNGQVKLITDVKPAARLWTIQGLTHNLESETPSGAWFSEVEANTFGNPAQ